MKMTTMKIVLMSTLLLILIAIPAVYYVVSIFFLSGISAIHLIVILSVFIVLSSLMIILIINKLITNQTKITINKMRGELKWLNLIINNTNEIIMVLNKDTRIMTFNHNLTKLLNYTEEEIIGKPLREILYEEYLDHNEMIQSKLRDIYSGNETEMICTCKKKNDSEIFEISFRMLPIIDGGDVENILVIGRLHEGDFLTRNYLINESSNYIIDNNLTQIFLLCYRLTRNLEKRFAKSDIFLAQIALQEVLMNAIEHGNLEIDFERKTSLKLKDQNYWKLLISEANKDYLENRKIYVSYYLDAKKVIYTIRDEGRGFDWKKYMSYNESTVEHNMLNIYHGIGLQIVKKIFNISFNARGNEVQLTRYFNTI
jgi:two-component system, sensor histidine kinase LadS